MSLNGTSGMCPWTLCLEWNFRTPFSGAMDNSVILYKEMALIQKGSDHGIGQKVQTVAHGIGVLKTGYDIGKALWSVGSTIAPYVGRAAAALI